MASIRPPGWALPYWRWLKTVKLDHAAQNATLLEYMVEVEHQGARLARLEKAIDEAIVGAPKEMKAVIDALQSLRGVAKLTAVTLAVEVGSFRRFERATQLMSYTGMVPSERSSLRSRRPRPRRDFRRSPRRGRAANAARL